MQDILRQRFWALVHATISSERKPKLVSLAHNEARLLFDGNRLFVILLDERPEQRQTLQDWTKVLVEGSAVREVDLIVIAESNQVDSALASADYEVPWTKRLAIGTLHEDGVFREITNKQFDAFVQGLIAKSLKSDLSEGSIAQMKLEVKAFFDDDRKQLSEVMKFQRKLSVQGDAATYALLGIIIAFYVMQSLVGGATYTPALVHMGANSEVFVRQGEYWRLMTSIFLHGGFLHVLANSYVLYALGIFFNRLIGNTRFITLFLFCGLMGGVSSVLIGGASLSVGASGAIWGLFGLSGALIVRPSHFLPDSVRQSMRRITFINLVINLGISFLPMVDLWAHLGGGIAGFALGLVYVYQGEHPKHRPLNRVTAIFLSLITVGCVGMNMAKERPWRLVEELKLTQRSIGHEGMTVGIPDVISAESQDGNFTVFGDQRFDPYRISIGRVDVKSEPLTVEQKRQFVEKSMQTSLEQLGYFKTEIRQRDIEGYPTASAYLKLKDDARLWIWFQMRGTTMISVDIVASPDTPTPLTQNLDQIIESIAWPS